MPAPRNPPVPRFAPQNSITLITALDIYGRAVDPTWTGEEVKADTAGGGGVCCGLWWHCRGGDGNRHGAEHDRTRAEGIGAGRTIGAGSAAGGGTQTGDCQGPDIDRGSRGTGRTDDAGGSGIAVAVDLQKRATIGRSALQQQGHQVSRTLVGELLNATGYSSWQEWHSD